MSENNTEKTTIIGSCDNTTQHARTAQESSNDTARWQSINREIFKVD